MAANPLPRPRTMINTFSANAATATSIGPAQPGDTIDWTNGTSSNITIAVSALNGYFPLTVNSFTVNGTQAPPNTYKSTIAANAPNGDYPFSRNGVAGAGHIKVGQGR